MNLAALKEKLKEKHKPYAVTDRDVLSSAMYPKVFDEYVEHRKRYSDLLPQVPTRAFLEGLEVDKELRIEIDKGRQVYVTLKAVGELLPNGRREVFFNLNGLPRLVEVEDRRAKEVAKGTASTAQAVRERANPDVLGEVGAPMSGTVIEVKVKAGETVKAGQALVAVSAMKMVRARVMDIVAGLRMLTCVRYPFCFRRRRSWLRPWRDSSAACTSSPATRLRRETSCLSSRRRQRQPKGAAGTRL